MLSQEEFEDVRCGDKVKCMLHQKVVLSPELIDGEYKERLTCGNVN